MGKVKQIIRQMRTVLERVRETELSRDDVLGYCEYWYGQRRCGATGFMSSVANTGVLIGS